MSVARKILSNTAAQVVGKGFSAVLSLVGVKIITYYLGQGSYGDYSYVYEFFALFAIIADFGLFTIAVREMSSDEKNIPKILGNVLTLRVIIGLLVFTGIITAGFFIPSHQGTKIPYAIMIAATASLIGLTNGIITSVLQQKYKMQYDALIKVIGKMVQIIYMLLTAFVFFANDTSTGFYHLFWAGVISSAVMLLLSILIVSRYTEIRFRYDKVLMKTLLRKAAPYGLALFLSNLYFRIDGVLIYNIRGKEEEGLYAVAVRMREALALLPLFFMNAVLPTLTKFIKEKGDKYKRVLQYTFDFQFILSIPFLVGGLLLAKPLIFLISTPEYVSNVAQGFYGSDLALQIILFSFVLGSLNIIFNYTLIAISRQAQLLWINGACAVFNLVANLIVIPLYGFPAAAVTTVASEILVLILVLTTAKRYLSFSISLKRPIKTLISALMMGGVVWLLKEPMLGALSEYGALVLVVIGGGVYGISLFATRAITKDIIMLLKR
ncbi:oligosaccharide flippase family protein [Candidatus Peregrinibacteria bacterium]|nr:oligosaccharide flippase family protein [Candidatus Peregrinibacteria bacterium]